MSRWLQGGDVFSVYDSATHDQYMLCSMYYKLQRLCSIPFFQASITGKQKEIHQKGTKKIQKIFALSIDLKRIAFSSYLFPNFTLEIYF